MHTRERRRKISAAAIHESLLQGYLPPLLRTGDNAAVEQTPHPSAMTFREKLWNVIHNGKGQTGHAFNLLLIVLIILSIAILPLELIPTLSEYHGMLTILEIITTIAFTIEYILRIYAAPRRLRYIFSFYGFVDLFSILPFYFAFFGTQYIRALRLIRLVKIGEIEAAAAEEEDETMEHAVGLADNEQVEYIVTHHPLYLFFGCIPPVLACSAGLTVLLTFPYHPVSLSISGVLFFFALIFLWKAWLDFSYDVLYITSQRLISQNQHILGRSINQVNYHAITNVKPFYPSMVSYLLGYGSIVIETPSAAVGHIELSTVREHEKAAHIIMHKCFPPAQEKVEALGDGQRGQEGQ
ncbi:MAG: ion transporter [Candidatus Peregrinibacteria bacterium]|nr:ion transporter [Candidatus Peregrinibacteria bacterium]